MIKNQKKITFINDCNVVVDYSELEKAVYVTIDGITKTLTEWAEFAGLNKSTLKNRYFDGVRGVMLLHKSENTKFKKGYNKYDNPRHYKDYKPPTIIEAEVSE